MRYVDFKDMTQDQKDRVRLLWPRRVPVSYYAFAINDDGSFNMFRKPRASSEQSSLLNEIFDGPPPQPEKGDINHFKTCEFGLNRE